MRDSAASAPLTALAFDFGLKRIGLAVGDTITGRAAPRPAIAGGPDWAAIGREVRDLAPAVLVVGAPLNEDGSAGTMAAAAKAFAQELERRFGLPVRQVDERWSSLEASAALKESRAGGTRARRVRKEDVDSAAAAVILERWLAGERS
jgi:putative Holliday junction resolvase